MPGLYPLGHRSSFLVWWPILWGGPLKPQTYGELHEYLWFYIILGEVQNKIYWLGVELYENIQIKHNYDRHSIDHWVLGLPVINTPFLHASMGAQKGFLFDEPPI